MKFEFNTTHKIARLVAALSMSIIVLIWKIFQVHTYFSFMDLILVMMAIQALEILDSSFSVKNWSRLRITWILMLVIVFCIASFNLPH